MAEYTEKMNKIVFSFFHLFYAQSAWLWMIMLFKPDAYMWCLVMNI